MTYTNILVHVESDGSSSDRVQIASDLAVRFEAKLIGVAAAAPRPPIVSEGGIIEAERDEILADLDRVRDRFQGLASIGRHKTEWRSAVDFPTDLLVDSADLADLLIIGRTDPDRVTTPYRSVDPGDILMRAGRPVLLTPPAVRALDGRNVLVAWSTTREARRAVSDALPFLTRAKKVTVVRIADRDFTTARKEVSNVLSWFEAHDLSVETDLRFDVGSAAADEIIDAAENAGADLIVAGAYGHTRFREWAFGGVTRDLLRRSPVCCLMAH